MSDIQKTQTAKKKIRIPILVFVLAIFIQASQPNFVTYIITLLYLLAFSFIGLYYIAIITYSVVKDGLFKVFATKVGEEPPSMPKKLNIMTVAVVILAFVINNTLDSTFLLVLLCLSSVYFTFEVLMMFMNMKIVREVSKPVKE